MTDRIENPMFLHCRACITFGITTSYEIATNGIEIQVWCRTCDREVSTLILQDQFQRERDELKSIDVSAEKCICNGLGCELCGMP